MTQFATQAKALIAPLRAALYDYDADRLQSVLSELFAVDATVQLAHPFEDLDGATGLFRDAIQPLARAFPDLERRDWLVMAGEVPGSDRYWVGCGGYYTGTFTAPFLDIPATGHQASMRFHEFYQIAGGKVVAFQALWDIPELMMQANAWPMVPSLGREWLVPGPATQDGLTISDPDGRAGAKARGFVESMLLSLKESPKGVDAMRLEDYWHPKFSWYGPAGIGTARGVSGFRNWHQIPFLNAMPDRAAFVGEGSAGNLFAEGDYVGFTAWPGMQATITGDGWMGIAPSNQAITMRSLDFWRCETAADGGYSIRENWVLVDLLHVYAQIGVDVLARMREVNKARGNVSK